MSDEYDKKLRDMQKYVPFLENLIQNLKKSNKHDEKREAQLNKMQMFYELLTNKNKKLKLETLERCEQVLVKLHQKAEKMKLDLPLTTDLAAVKNVETAAKSQSPSAKATPDKPIGQASTVQKVASKPVKTSCETTSTGKLTKIDTKTTSASAKSDPSPSDVALPSISSQKSEIESDKKKAVVEKKSTEDKKAIEKKVVEEKKAVEEKKILEDNKSVEEKKAVEETKVVDEKKSVEETKIVDEKKKVDETKTNPTPPKTGVEETEINSQIDLTDKSEIPDLTKKSEETKLASAAENPIEPEKLDEPDTLPPISVPPLEASKELKVESSTDKADSVSPDPNEKLIPTNMTDDWKSTKRKIEPGPSHESEDKPENCPDDSLEHDSQEAEVITTKIPDVEEEEGKKEDNESEPACSSMQCAIEAKTDASQEAEQVKPNKDECPKEMLEIEPQNEQSQQTVSSSTLKNDPEECSVSSTTIIDPRREKTTGDESDEQNSLQDTVTDSSSNNDAVNKNWIQGALLNLLNPNTIDKSTVLNMLEKVVEGPKFQQIKAILTTDEDNNSSTDNGKAQNDNSEDTTKKVEDKKAVGSGESVEKAVAPVQEKKLVEPKPHTKVRRTELDRLNEDVRFILDTDPENLGPQTKRACTENKTPNYCEIGPEPKQKAPPKEVEATAPKPKKKKKKYEVFSYRTRRRSKRKKKATSKVAALAGIESGADGTESSLGGQDMEEEHAGDDNLLEELHVPSEEIDAENISNADDEHMLSLPSDISKEELTEEERSFKNIHPEMHSLSKYVSTCAICKFSGRYVTTHYMNSHRMNEMVVSRLPPSAQERLMRGEGVNSVFSGKDPFQNRVYHYVCPFCNVKKCYARKIWSQHFGSHTGEYKYKCSGCGYMSVNVRGHIMKYCPGAKPIMLENLDRGHDIVAFICKLCNYIQMNRDHVTSHIENQHEIAEGIEELITELILFRSDMRNMQGYNSKKGKVVEVSAKSPQTVSKQEAPTAGHSQAKKGVKSVESEESVQNEAEELPLVKMLSSSKFLIPKPADGGRLKNIYPYMHSQSEYVTRCVLCSYAGKFITKHYVKEHPTFEVYVARIPPDRQNCILNDQQLTKIGPVTVVKYKNYYRHSACPFCPVEKSSQRFDWVMHFAIHTGEYKFRCTQCNHYGNARNEFARHFKNGCPNGKLVRLWAHYKYNEEDPVVGYLCKLCNYIQMSRNNVVNHLNSEHGTKAEEIREITLFSGNPRYKGRRSVKGYGGKKSKRAKRRIKHVVERGILNVPDFLCEGVVDEEFMAEEGMLDDIPGEDTERSPLADDDMVLPMHQMPDDFGDAGFEHLFQMEMDETATAAAAAEQAVEQPEQSQEANDTKTEDDQELTRPPEDPMQNIHPEMHSLSPYASKCLLCNFAGKYIAKHYVEEHTDYEVFASRLPPAGQRSLLSGEGSMPTKCVIRSRKMNYFFPCPFCNLERDCTRHNWVAHFGIHTGEYKYKCSQCSHRGNASRDFKRHFKGSCRFAKQIRQWPDLVSKEEPILAYYCNLCNFIQLDRGRVVKHLNTQHSCYEPLISKLTLLFIDPKTQLALALAASMPGATLPLASVKHRSLKRRLGKHGKKRRPISKMWSTSSQKRAQLKRRTEVEQEERDEGEDGVEAEVEDATDAEFNGGDEENQASGGDDSGKDADVIEIEDSDEEKPTVRENSAVASSYEKIQKFIERTEQKGECKSKVLTQIKMEDVGEPTPKCEMPLPKERPLTNIHPEMHSQSIYAKKCILCPFNGRHLINHYISFHPRFEVPISRLPPAAQALIVANKSNVAIEIESNPFSPKLFSHICVFCDTEFTFAIKSWVDHIGTHTGEYNFKCSECGRMINSKHDIYEHIRHFCRKGKALARHFPVTDNQQLLAHICKLCNFVQMNRGNIHQHLRGQHRVAGSAAQIMQVTLIRFDKISDSKPDTKLLVPKKEDRIKVENSRADTKYTTREYVKVEQSDAIYEILVPETALKVPSATPSTSKKVKTEPGTDTPKLLTRQSFQGGLATNPKGSHATIVNQRPGATSITIRRSAPPATAQQAVLPAATKSNSLTELDVVQRISHLGYSVGSDGTTKYHCCVRACNFTATVVPITLATHIMDYHPTLIWEGYCRECQGHVATGKNMKLTKEIQHLFEHTRKRPAGFVDPKEEELLTPPLKMQRLSDVTPANQADVKPGTTPSAPDDSADQIIARFANNKSITITREVKPASPDSAPTIMQSITFPPQNAATSKQQQVLKEVKRTALKPWTVSKSLKTENTVISLLSDIALFAFFKCMGNDCQFTTNDSNKMAEHLALHSDLMNKEINTDQPSSPNVFSWLECCYCSTWAGTVMQLIAHITAKHSRDIYQCPYCFYRSCEEYNVVVHEKHYHSNQRLSILFCFGRRLLKPGGDLAIHTVKRIKCGKCPCTFMNPLAFATHVAEYTDIDLGGDIYKCYYCSKKHTKSIIEFARHIVEHRPVRKADGYRCYQCFKKQTQLNQLPIKQSTKSYTCVHCAYSTDDESQMGLHMAQVHASNLLFCGLRIRITSGTLGATEESANRLDNGAAFVLLKKPVDDALMYKCPYTPTQLNYLSTAIEPLPQEYECKDENMDSGSCSSPVITQNPGGLRIAQVQSISDTQFASLITIDDDDDD